MRFALCLADANAGSSIAARMAMIAMTTSSSISVNAGEAVSRRVCFSVFTRLSLAEAGNPAAARLRKAVGQLHNATGTENNPGFESSKRGEATQRSAGLSGLILSSMNWAGTQNDHGR